MAKCYVEYLLGDDVEVGYKELVTIEEDQDDRDFTPEDKAQFQEWKVKFAYHIGKSVKRGHQAGQSWLVFNAAIELWNNYLPLFKKVNFFELILAEGIPALIECFEAMNSCFIQGGFQPGDSVDYELDRKMQVFSSLSMMLARIYEFQDKREDAVRVCNVLLEKQLPSHLKKTFDSIKARVTKQVAAQAAGKQAAPGGKGGAKGGGEVAAAPSKAD